MAGVVVSPNASIDPDTGDLLVVGTAVANGPGQATVNIVAVESLIIIGVGSATVVANGQYHDYTASVPAVNGPWQTSGSAQVSAVLVDPSGAQVAYGVQNVTVY